MESETKKSPYNPNGSNDQSFFDNLNSKTAFFLGLIASVLVISTIGFIILASCMLGGSCTGLSTNKTDAPDQIAAALDDLAPNPAQIPSGEIPEITNEDHVRGNLKSKVTFVEYSDFECPFCSRFSKTVDEVYEEYGDKVRFVYRHFPLSFHPQSRSAALASECAGEQGKFWEYHNKLFENQKKLGEKVYNEIADDLGINNNKFKDCIKTEKYASKISSQAQGGGAAGVSGTPGSFIIDANGEKTPIKGALPFDSVQPLIEAALK